MIKKGIILASGMGSRLGEETQSLPKPLLKVGTKCILDHIIERFIENGIESIGINTFYLSEKIEAHIKNHNYDAEIFIHSERKLTGTAGVIPSFMKFIGFNDFLVHYGDILTNHPLNSLTKCKENALGNILIHKNQNSNSFLKLNDNGTIEEFHERPKTKPSLDNYWANSGIYYFKNNFLDYFKNLNLEYPIDFPNDIFPAMVVDGLLTGSPLVGSRIAIDSLERLNFARNNSSSYTNR